MPSDSAAGRAGRGLVLRRGAVAGLDDAEARELERRLRRAAALEQGLLARIGPLLLAFADLRGPLQLGFRSLDGYARERLAMSPRKARALLRLERACALAPALGEAWRSGRSRCPSPRLSSPLVLAAASEPFHSAWIERAADVTVRRLEDDVEHALASGGSIHRSCPRLPETFVDRASRPLTLPEGVQIGAEHTGAEGRMSGSRTCPRMSAASSAPASARWRAA